MGTETYTALYVHGLEESIDFSDNSESGTYEGAAAAGFLKNKQDIDGLHYDDNFIFIP